jgi:Cd2+/Zn2+-exporting ATPase
VAVSHDRDGFPTYHFAAAGAAGSSSTLLPPASAVAQPSSSSAAAAAGPLQVAVLCYEDIIQQGVAQAVQQLRSGTWADGSLQPKQVVMLTGDHPEVAAAVAGAVGISDYRASLRPEHKLQYVQQHSQLATDLAAAAAGVAAERISSRKMLSALFLGGGKGSKQQGLVMMGDGINDAPALAAASVGVAVAATPNDLVAAAADVIVLNGQGVANLPPLFSLAQRTQAVVRQNLALALLSVVFATVPTVAGIFPLWLAVTLHEGSTLLVAINSLRLLLDEQQGSSGAGGLAREAMASLAPRSAAAAGVAAAGPGAAMAPGAAGEAHQHQHEHSPEQQHHGHDHEHSSHEHHHHHHHHEDGQECCGGQQQGGGSSGSVASSVPVSSLTK